MRLTVAVIVVASSAALVAQSLPKWTLPANATSAWVVVHLKNGGTQSFTIEASGAVVDGGVMTRGEHDKAMVEMRLNSERWEALRESYAIAGDSRPAVIKYLKGLQSLDGGALAQVGILDKGKYRPLTAADLACERP
jgi:hypothetical protein